MTQKNTKTNLTIEWILPDKQIIKFQEKSDDTFELADHVVDYVNELKEDDVVSVTLEDNTVVFIKKVEGDKKNKKSDKKRTKRRKSRGRKKQKETNVDDEKQGVSDSEEVNWTVKGIPSNKKVVKFEEDDKIWYFIPEHIRDNFETVSRGDKISVKLGMAFEDEKEKQAVVEIVDVVKNEKPKNTNKKTRNDYENPDTARNSSIEKQVALKESGAIVRTFIEGKVITSIDEANQKFEDFYMLGLKLLNK